MASGKRDEKIKILNTQIKSCDRCHLSSVRIQAICGEGNPHARIFFIAQAPGEVEDRKGMMFVGPTGKVMDELFLGIHMNRNEIFMTNLIKCRLTKNRKPKQNEIDMCGRYLENELAIIKPDYLIPLGYHATKYIFRRYCSETSLPSDSAGKLFYCGGFKIYPLPHPSSVLYNAAFIHTMKALFNKIKIFMKECKWYPVCPMKWFYEQGNLESKWIELYCKGDWESCVRYQMEENNQPHPDNMLPDGKISDSLR